MPSVELAPGVSDDLERIFDHLSQYDLTQTPTRIAEILEALRILEHSPSIGRPVPNGLRELVVGHRSRGYIALYRHLDALDVVLVLAIRSQSEAGYQAR